jgi:hypothetical protein
MRNTGSSVRDRIEMLIDPGTPLLELSTLAANQTYEGEVQLRVPIGQAWCGARDETANSSSRVTTSWRDTTSCPLHVQPGERHLAPSIARRSETVIRSPHPGPGQAPTVAAATPWLPRATSPFQ